MQASPLLLVDDNPDDIELTLRALRSSKVSTEVVVASGGQQALELLLPADGGAGLQPAVVLLDLKMPRIDGLEVLRRLREDPRTALLPVVILTTSREERDRVESYALGANSYVAKPVDFGEFLEAARLLSLYWAGLNVPPPRRTAQTGWG